MANATKSGVHVIQLKKVHVPTELMQGQKCIRWDEELNLVQQIQLKVDSQGFYLIYESINNKENIELLDIALIRDTRCGARAGAKVPKDGKFRAAVTIGNTMESLDDKILTVVSGSDFVNVTYWNFSCSSIEVAKVSCFCGFLIY